MKKALHYGAPFAGYAAGYAVGNKQASKKTPAQLTGHIAKHNKKVRNTTLGTAGAATYLSFTPAGRRPFVNHGLAATSFATGFYAGHTQAHSARKRMAR